MPDLGSTITIISFVLTMIVVLWRPRGLNEAIPATYGAAIVLLSGTVPWNNVKFIGESISGAAITIIATMIMAITLESAGFFWWAAEGLLARARGSGIKLYWYVNLLCFLMTMFFNNDGSILITTPIIILLLNNLGLKNHQKIPYLISGALIATASSALIGVSNVVNLISLSMVHLSLIASTRMMFVPTLLGIIFLALLLFAHFYSSIPRTLSMTKPGSHPLQSAQTASILKDTDRTMKNILLYVLLMRISLFLASYVNIPIQYVAIVGSLLLLLWRWIYLKIAPIDILRKTPWHIFIFAFSMYIIIYGLHNIGLTDLLVSYVEPIASGNLLAGCLTMGGLLSLLSNLFNNHPALMIGTLTLTNLNIDPYSMHVLYLANVVGSDIGSLILPMGTLASLIWLHILKHRKIKIDWGDYVKTALLVIPPTLLFTLACLYTWVTWAI